MDISQSFRDKNVGHYAIRRLHELLLEASGGSQRPLQTGRATLKIELSSAKDMEVNWQKQMKNLILAQLEVLYITCRKDKEYSYELFREFEHTEEFMELLLEFPDDSTLLNSY
jgi:hypothetical protein